MKKVFLALSLLFLLLIIIIFLKAFTWSSKQVSPKEVILIEPGEESIQRLQKSITFKTISFEDSTLVDTGAFNNFHSFLKEAFPSVYKHLLVEKIEGKNLLFYWKGSRQDLKPILILAHQDVVPVENEDSWEEPPFSGSIKDGYIWGRGALDDKSSILGILEATEMLLKNNFKPERSIYFAFGWDEEKGGRQGAKVIAENLIKRNIQFEYILDEGGVIISGAMPGVNQPVAVVGVAEKGYLSLALTVQSVGGHSSMPPAHTAIGKLSRAIHKIEDSPFPGKIAGATGYLFDYVGPKMNFGYKIIFANQWLFSPIIKKILASSPSTNATIRTTTATTIFQSGTKDNVLPSHARAVVNFRIIPGETREMVIQRIKEIIEDSSISVKALPFSSDPSFISSPESPSFITIQKTIKEVYPNVIVAPYLVLAATDSRHYSALSSNIYRFFPATLEKKDLDRIHGANERIEVENYKKVINFYFYLIKNSMNIPSK